MFEQLLLESTSNGDTCEASVSVRSLAAQLGVAKDTVARALNRLRRAGLVDASQSRTATGVYATGIYTLTIPTSITLDDHTPPPTTSPSTTPHPTRAPHPRRNTATRRLSPGTNGPAVGQVDNPTLIQAAVHLRGRGGAHTNLAEPLVDWLQPNLGVRPQQAPVQPSPQPCIEPPGLEIGF